MPTQFSPRDLVTAHLPDGRTVEGEYWSHPRADHACVIDWSPRYGVNAWGGRVRQVGRVFVTIVPGTIVHPMSVRPCSHVREAVDA